jgi:transcriptional regulator with XRE-family HTH domain
LETLQISLAAARVNAELTQKDVADKMKVDRSTVRRWERGEKIPDYDESKKLSQIYKIPLDNIFFGKRSRLK